MDLLKKISGRDSFKDKQRKMFNLLSAECELFFPWDHQICPSSKGEEIKVKDKS